ncbi:hypothetical protein RclHR1_24300003 [Rhizophagus clarus]|uniref:Uncharacterized protein n=1 Tax=Rhizophagus clarus TaxID=94130 RepID=A0A2Z6RAJ3_9GLOM|nr:hypothetical protein RclHR1_24300003 [Rhizophagus clarus]
MESCTNPTLISDPDTWTDNDFKAIKNTLQHYLPLIRYFSLSSEEFYTRCQNVDGIIDSKIVNLNIVSLISRWIDKIDIKSKYAYTRELYLPYKFKLSLRGSRDGFTPKIM